MPYHDAYTRSMPERVELVGSIVAGRWADDVDGEGRFPSEAVEGLGYQRVLGSAVPARLGGEGAALAQMCESVRGLARHCASAATVLAVHQAMVFTIGRRGRGDRAEKVLREIAADQLLVTGCLHEPVFDAESGQSTTEGATVLFGGDADLVIVRVAHPHDPDGPGSHRLAVIRNDEIRSHCEVPGDGLGLRGLGWNTYSLATFPESGAVLDGTYDAVVAETLAPVLDVMVSAVRAGIADVAVDTARRYVAQCASRRCGDGGVSRRLEEAANGLEAAWADVVARAHRIDDGGAAAGTAPGDAGRGAGAAVAAAMEICGPAGYRETGKFSLGRQFRDAMGASAMVVAAIGPVDTRSGGGVHRIG